MNANFHFLNAKFIICIAASAACAVLLAPAQAKSHEVAVKTTVSTAGLDPSQPADARELYARLRKAAYFACADGGMVGLEPVANLQDCLEKALGNAVRSAHLRQLNIAYLATHTASDAAKYGIEVPGEVAAD
jgi:UrcA family protein